LFLLVDVLPAEDLGDAAVADAELSGDVAGADALMGELYDAGTDDIGQGSSVDENAAELVDSAVAFRLRRK
jgi:hypothetical protein